MRTQFMVKESNKLKRSKFFDYITSKYDLYVEYPYFKEDFVNNNFPFVIDFEDKSFWICESVTCCACAASNKVLFTIDEFMKMRR